MKALVIRQPWASLIAHGIKTIETRGFAPRTSLQPGDQFAIVAGKATRHVVSGEHYGGWRVVKDGGMRLHDFAYPDTTYHECPLGAVVAVVTYDAALPVVAESNCADFPAPPQGMLTITREGHPIPTLTRFVWSRNAWTTAPALYCERASDGIAPTTHGQLPLGDFTPGRYGWLLSDPRRLTTPVPCPATRPDGTRTVMQGVFTLPDDVLADVLPQITAKDSDR